MGQMIVEDLIDSWRHILIGLVISMVSCLILIAMMRFLATPLVWISIIGVIGMLGFCKYKRKFNKFHDTKKFKS